MGRLQEKLFSEAASWDEYSDSVTRQKPKMKAIRESTFALPSPYNRPNPSILEADVLKATLATLQKRGVWHRRIENQGVIHWSAGEGVLGASRQTGMADVLALVNGHFLALELKRPGGRVKGCQLQELRSISQQGGIGAILCLPDSCSLLLADLIRNNLRPVDPVLQVLVY